MIIGLDDILPELQAEYDKIKPKSVEKIIRAGLQRTRALTVRSNELIMHSGGKDSSSDKLIKIFIPMTPEKQRLHAWRGFFRRQRAEEIKNEKANTESI